MAVVADDGVEFQLCGFVLMQIFEELPEARAVVIVFGKQAEQCNEDGFACAEAVGQGRDTMGDKGVEVVGCGLGAHRERALQIKA